MLHTAKLFEQIGVVGNIDPDAYTVNSYSTGWIDMSQWQDLLAIIQAGDLGSSATLDGKFEQALTDGGSPKDISPARAITQMTQAGTDKSNKQALLHLRAEELDVDNGYRFARLTLAVGTATSDVGAVVIGSNGRHGPVSSYDASSVDQMVG